MGLSRIHYVALGAVLVVLAVAATLLTAESHAEAELGNNRPSNTLDVEIPGVQHGAGANSQVSGGVTTASNAAASGASSSVPGASSSVPGSSSSAAAHSGSGVSSDGSSSTALTGSGGGNVGGSSDAREGRPSNSGDGGDGGSSGEADARNASGKPEPRADMNTFHLVSAPATFVADKKKCGGAPWAIKMQTALAQVAASSKGIHGPAWPCNTRKPKVGILVLTSSSESDMANLLIGVASLKHFVGEDEPAPLIVFHEDLSDEQQQIIRDAAAQSHALSPRPVSFHAIEYDVFPPGFNADVEEPNWRKRSKWGYHQMIRWWAYRVWHHPAVVDLELAMRLDTDACYTGPLEYPMKHMLSDCSKVYRPYGVQSDTKPVQHKFHETFRELIKCVGIKPANPAMMAYESYLAKYGHQGLFNDHFEVVRVPFMRRPDVMAFVERLTEYEPYGVFRWRWGDHIVRYALLALFAPPRSLDLRPLQHYRHPCSLTSDKVRTKLSFPEMIKRGW